MKSTTICAVGESSAALVCTVCTHQHVQAAHTIHQQTPQVGLLLQELCQTHKLARLQMQSQHLLFAFQCTAKPHCYCSPIHMQVLIAWWDRTTLLPFSNPS